MEMEIPPAFDALFNGNFPHILENIFFSLDPKSFGACCRVSNKWRQCLNSERFRAHFDISHEERELMLASMRNDVTTAKRLLTKGLVDVNCTKGERLSDNGFTPLHWAARNGKSEVAKLLLDMGANPNVKCNKASTPLNIAAEFGHTDVVRLLIDRGIDQSDVNETLHCAARKGNTELVRMLLDKGANINVKSVEGKTPLSRAAEHGHPHMARLLMDRGADPNGTERCGTTQLHSDIKVPNLGLTPLHIAAINGHSDVVQILMDRGADTNRTDLYGRTPLQYAVVQCLIEWGVDPNKSQVAGNIPLFLVAIYNPRNRRAEGTNLVRTLLDGGADPNVSALDPDSEQCGITPLQQATEFGHTDLVRLLLDRGADPNESDRFGTTLLHHVAQCGNTDLARLLIKRGAEPDKKDSMGQTPIHIAADNGHTDLMRVLVIGGASPFDHNKEGKSALDLYQQLTQHCRQFNHLWLKCMLGCAWGILKCCSYSCSSC